MSATEQSLENERAGGRGGGMMRMKMKTKMKAAVSKDKLKQATGMVCRDHHVCDGCEGWARQD